MLNSNNKVGLLVTRPVSNHKNIGDYIQSLAASQYSESIDVYVNKEEVSKYEGDGNEVRVKMIMNGWYMWHPENWPPKEVILPLLTSVHISPLNAEKMLSPQGKNFLIKYGPVGCRDLGTLDILKSHNIPAYYSACLTLTLGYKFKNLSNQRRGILFVDPYFAPLSDIIGGKRKIYFKNALRGFVNFLRNPVMICKISKNDFFCGRFLFMKFYNASMFYSSYKTKFSNEAILNARYLTHMVPVNHGVTDSDLLKESEKLVRLYAKSSMVITSRIHCALPCLGLGTPMIFVINEIMRSSDNIFNAPNRFGGLINLFRVMEYNYSGLSTSDEVLSKIDHVHSSTSFDNKKDWIPYKDALIKMCTIFFA